ncbi:MAG: DGQHR domain-containing protein [Clostridia bacterium]|nr:DGQHR domain-containing protein [Clostridia bacterium]
MKKKTKKNKKPMTEEQKREYLKKKKEAAFRKKIKTCFTNSGFEFFPTENKEFKIGNRVVELDYLFLYENVLIICEDTCGKRKNKEHIRKKNESFSEIKDNIPQLLDWLKNTFQEKEELINKYQEDRFLVYYIYISQAELDLTDDEKRLYSNLIFWEPETLAYFHKMSQCIYYSARYEIFRYLNISDDQIGYSGSAGRKTVIKAPIIYPKDATGLRNGIRVVSFMMSAEKLIHTSYVLRKDNWEESMFLYQRLIEKDKIKSIRAFLAEKGEAFHNNIIVALPDNVTFEDDSGKPVLKEKIGDFQHCKLVLPDEMNSICVIDGQHRIFAHYEAPASEKYESQIARLRKQLHLLVTGLIFPDGMKDVERKQIQSQIFLDINNNTKKVAANVLTHIETIKDPFSDIGLARRVIERLNKERTFLNRFELSELDENKIKVASIIKFALRYLVTVSPAEGRESLFKYWDGDKQAFLEKDEAALNNYIDFCTKKIDLYFSTIKDTFKNSWNDTNSKLQSVIAINGFIIAFNRQLLKNGIQDYDFYNQNLQKLSIDFSKDNFPYTSSQYRKFSNQILKEAFDFNEEELENS